MRTRTRRHDGFAFLFTLLLVAVLAVSLLLATEVDSTLVRREREAALLQVGHEFRQALARYQAARVGASAGQYPLQLDELLLDNRFPRAVRHLRRIYVDPMTGKDEWGLVRQGGRIVGVYSLALAEPIKVDGFDVEDSAFKGAKRYRDWVFLYPGDRTLVPPGAASAPPASFGAVPLPATQR